MKLCLFYAIFAATTVVCATEGPRFRGSINSTLPTSEDDVVAPLSPKAMGNKTERRASVRCRTVTFQTSRLVDYAESPGPFFLHDYGMLSSSCHNRRGASCTVNFCSDRLQVTAGTGDGWFFRVVENGRTLQSTGHSECSGCFYYAPEFSWMDQDQFSYEQEYKYYYTGQRCHVLKFQTAKNVRQAESNDSFMLYKGSDSQEIPSNCKNREGAECNLVVCSPSASDTSFRIRSYGNDGWNFKVEEIDADTGGVRQLRLLDFDGLHPDREMNYGYVWMDTDQFSNIRYFDSWPTHMAPPLS